MADLQLECWYDLGDAICMLPDDHDGPHGPTPIDEIWVSLVTERPNVTPVEVSEILHAVVKDNIAEMHHFREAMRPLRPNVTPVNDTTGDAIGVGALLLAAVVLSVVLSVPWVVGAWNIVLWIIR